MAQMLPGSGYAGMPWTTAAPTKLNDRNGRRVDAGSISFRNSCTSRKKPSSSLSLTMGHPASGSHGPRLALLIPDNGCACESERRARCRHLDIVENREIAGAADKDR